LLLFHFCSKDYNFDQYAWKPFAFLFHYAGKCYVPLTLEKEVNKSKASFLHHQIHLLSIHKTKGGVIDENNMMQVSDYFLRAYYSGQLHAKRKFYSAKVNQFFFSMNTYDF
jgi:hypothetical protein